LLGGFSGVDGGVSLVTRVAVRKPQVALLSARWLATLETHSTYYSARVASEDASVLVEAVVET